MTKTIMDAEVPFPLIRPRRFVEADQNRTYHSKTVVTINTDGREEKSKFSIPVYAKKQDEDLVSLVGTLNSFEAWARAKNLWGSSPSTNTRDLFTEFEKCLAGAALQQWQEVMSRRAPSLARTWPLFKKCVAEFIVKKIVKRDDCYRFQCDYLGAREMPDSQGYHFTDYYDSLLLINSMMKWLLNEPQIIVLKNIEDTLPYVREQRANTLLWNTDGRSNTITGTLSNATLVDYIIRAVPEMMSDKFREQGGDTSTPLEDVATKMKIYDEIRKKNNSLRRRNPGEFRGGGRKSSPRRQGFNRNPRTTAQGNEQMGRYPQYQGHYHSGSSATQYRPYASAQRNQDGRFASFRGRNAYGNRGGRGGRPGRFGGRYGGRSSQRDQHFHQPDITEHPWDSEPPTEFEEEQYYQAQTHIPQETETHEFLHPDEQHWLDEQSRQYHSITQEVDQYQHEYSTEYHEQAHFDETDNDDTFYMSEWDENLYHDGSPPPQPVGGSHLRRNQPSAHYDNLGAHDNYYECGSHGLAYLYGDPFGTPETLAQSTQPLLFYSTLPESPPSSIRWTEHAACISDSILSLDACFLDESDVNDVSQDASSVESTEENIDPTQLLTTEIILAIKVNGEERLFRSLLDTGTSRTLGTRAAIRRAHLDCRPNKKTPEHKYLTSCGTFRTSQYATIRKHRVVDLSGRRQLTKFKVQVHEGRLGDYDFILGRDYLQKYGFKFDFEYNTINWDGQEMEMHQKGFWTSERMEDLFFVIENPSLEALLNGDLLQNNFYCSSYRLLTTLDNDCFAAKILDSLYEKQDLTAVVNRLAYLSDQQKTNLRSLLAETPALFDGKLGTFQGPPVDVELKPGSVPYHCRRPMRVPHIHRETLRKEIDRLVAIGVLERTGTTSPWCAPTFIVPKKDGRVRVITDYRMLNRCIVRHPWPMPHITDLIEDVGRYSYCTAIDLSMGYYHIRLTDRFSNMTTFMLPFGRFRYKRLAMGLNISPDYFQRIMGDLFHDMPNVKVYLDDILLATSGSFADHLTVLREVLHRLKQAGMAVNAEKTYWATNKPVEYLGFLLTPQGLRPQPKKVAAILRMTSPRTRKELRRVIGYINYYRYMWRRRSHLLAPMTTLLSTKRAFLWNEECQQAFTAIKKIIAKEVLLTFPDYSKPFDLHTDASEYQMGAVLSQGDKPIAFFSKKLTERQQQFTVGEKEMLSIVNALQDFRPMIYGYPIRIHTDHLNLTYNDTSFKSRRVFYWRLAIEEFLPTLLWVPGESNVVADLLSRQPISDGTDEDDDLFAFLDECFDLPRDYTIPIDLKMIHTAQQSDPLVNRLKQQAPDRLGTIFDNTGDREGPHQALTIRDPLTNIQRMIIPKDLRPKLLQWYHTMLIHPGSTRLYNTLHQHYTWPKMDKDIQQYCKTCPTCQKAKRGLRGYGKVPLKDVETQPWKDVCLDLSGPWTANVKQENGTERDVQFHALTLIDPFTGWPEIVPIYTKEASYIRNLILQQWLRRYPRPSRMIYDQGGEFDNAWLYTLCKRWRIKPEPITVRNPRANAIVERLHKTMADMIRCQLVKKNKNDDPVADILSAAAYGVRATVHGTTRYSPGQLVFSKDMILRTHVEADLEYLRQRRRQASENNNERENRRRLTHKYKKGDKILIIPQRLDPKLKLHEGPYKVVDYHETSGTLQIQRGQYVEPINIRLVRPYFGKKKVPS